jgi:hypothetical protein
MVLMIASRVSCHALYAGEAVLVTDTLDDHKGSHRIRTTTLVPTDAPWLPEYLLASADHDQAGD